MILETHEVDWFANSLSAVKNLQLTILSLHFRAQHIAFNDLIWKCCNFQSPLFKYYESFPRNPKIYEFKWASCKIAAFDLSAWISIDEHFITINLIVAKKKIKNGKNLRKIFQMLGKLKASLSIFYTFSISMNIQKIFGKVLFWYSQIPSVQSFNWLGALPRARRRTGRMLWSRTIYSV